MENLWWLYIVAVLPQISMFFGCIGVVGTVIFVIRLIIITARPDDSDYKKPVTWLLVSCILSGFLCVLIPSKEGLYTIIAGVGITEVAKTDAAKRMSDKSIKILEAWLDQKLPTPRKKETK